MPSGPPLPSRLDSAGVPVSRARACRGRCDRPKGMSRVQKQESRWPSTFIFMESACVIALDSRQKEAKGFLERIRCVVPAERIPCSCVFWCCVLCVCALSVVVVVAVVVVFFFSHALDFSLGRCDRSTSSEKGYKHRIP